MIDAVVVAYGSRGMIAACLAALRQVEGLDGVVVVDHGSDGTGEMASSVDEGVVVISDPDNPGFGAGQNRGVRATSAPYVLLVNPDARVVADAVAAGVALLNAQSDVAVVQGVIASDAGGAPDRSQGRALAPVHLWGRALGLRRLLRFRVARVVGARVGLQDHVERVPTTAVDVEAMAATAWLMRRAAFDAVGGFDEGYFLYGEDMDLSRRLRDGGWRLVALPDRWAEHTGGASASSGWERELQWWQGTMTYAAQWWSSSAWTAALGAAAVRWLRLVARRPSGARRAADALLGVPRRRRRSVQ